MNMAWIPLSKLEGDCRRRNLQALAARRPDLAELLRRQTVREDILVETASRELHRCKKILLDGGEYWTDLEQSGAAETQAFLQAMSTWKPDQAWTFLFHIGAGHGLNFFQRRPIQSRPLIIIEPDPGFLLAAFSLFDLSALIASPLVYWIVGENVEGQLRQALESELYPFHLVDSEYRSFPGELVGALHPRPVWLNYEAIVKKSFSEAGVKFPALREEFARHYEHHPIRRIEKIAVLALQSGCWETLAQGLAEGFASEGKEVRILSLESLADAPAALKANLEVLRFRPDAIAIVDFPSTHFFGGSIHDAPIPRMIWYVDDPVNLPPGRHGPFDIAFPVDPSQAPDLERMGARMGGDIPLCASPNIQANYRPELASVVSFVGSIFDVSRIRRHLPNSTVERIESIVDEKLSDFKFDAARAIQERFSPGEERDSLLRILRQTVAKKNMTDENLLRYYFNLEFNCARRAQVIAALKDFPIKVYGSLDWGAILAKHGMQDAYQGRYLTMQEGFDLFRSSQISLNIHTMFTHSSPNERDFEIPLCGGFVLSDIISHAQSRMGEFFAVGKEMEAYGNLDELKTKVDYYLSHPQERDEITQAARERILRQHTFAHRARVMIAGAEAMMTQWKKLVIKNI
ncbi:MAG: glycosyltransferase [Candidatus Omnitrophota bacterium]